MTIFMQCVRLVYA